MNVKSFQNDIGIPVNVDLDLVDVASELPDGRALLRFGDQWVGLGVPYSEVSPQITAPGVRRVPLPPPSPPPADNTNNEGGQGGEGGGGNPYF